MPKTKPIPKVNSNTAVQKLAFFDKIPPEVLLNIIKNLKHLDKQLLRLTCKRFYALIKKWPLDNWDLQRIEQMDWPQLNGLLTCVFCHRMKPEKRFADNMQDGEMKRGAHFCIEDRLCLECALNSARWTGMPSYYSIGDEIPLNDIWHTVARCMRCRGKGLSI